MMRINPSRSIAATRRILGIAACAAAACTGAAHADTPGRDWKGYSGVNCLSQHNTESVRRSAVAQSALSNMGTTPVTVFCPVVRDVAEGGPGKVAAVAVRFRNRNAGATGRCEFSSHDQSGNKIDSKTAVAPFGETTLQLGPVNTHNWGSFVLQCQVPGRDPATGLPSYIVNYRVDEVL